MGRRTVILLAVGFALIIIGVLVYSSMNLQQYRVEVCMDYASRQACRTASGATEEFALRTAMSNACAQIASGVTETRGCELTTPTKVTWLKK